MMHATKTPRNHFIKNNTISAKDKNSTKMSTQEKQQKRTPATKFPQKSQQKQKIQYQQQQYSRKNDNLSTKDKYPPKISTNNYTTVTKDVKCNKFNLISLLKKANKICL
eukprot:TRINITY_DN8822_c0_g3_i4.p4 TRINITY_DN8822_c0_g3~~TRINITY_DN8822_c0_g3_i4.p4  ORF type:complete len:109 (-),score=1.50 TRINITY_DN8822_c0_g3_i4:557-883(-)